MASKSAIFIDGKYVDAGEDLIRAFTPGDLSGDGVFETIRTVKGRIEFFDEHLGRLFKGMRVLKIKCRYSPAQLKAIARRVLKRNSSMPLGRLRIIVMAGAPAHCVVTAVPYVPYTDTQYRRGLAAAVCKTSHPAGARHADVKSLAYARFAAQYRKGSDEAILVNARGHVCEATRSNLFCVYKGVLMTPPLSSGCLNGLQRRRVLEVARASGISVAEKNITPAMLQKADHIFLTNSLIGIIPCRLK